MLVRELLTAGAARITAGRDASTAWLDATVLWALVQNQPRDRILATLGDSAKSDSTNIEFLALCEKRSSGYPIAYLTGHKEFFGRDFLVDESVLIPRPETELLVEWMLETVANEPDNPLRTLDCCTGSGCIPVSFGLELGRLQRNHFLFASDLSAAALQTAERNRRILWPSGTIQWLQGDLLAALPPDSPQFNIICANPPYIPRTEARSAPAQSWREPVMALDGGPDGLDLLRCIIAQARNHLAPDGWLFLEFGDGQSEQIVGILDSYDYRSTEIRCDLAGLPRMVRSKYLESDGQRS